MSNIVAIVGRPNVGKSTLFNRLVESRQAITDPTAGTTRDRHYGKSDWIGYDFSVIDTGGYAVGSDDIFESAIREQVQLAIDEAKVIIFLVDVETGIHDFDKEVAHMLRQADKPVLLAVNKVDNSMRESDATEFYALGLGEYFTLSSINGSGTGELLDELVTHFEKEEEVEEDEIPKFTFVGRPNVGKSSLINTLLGTERNIVTDIAGTTRDTLETVYNKFGFEFKLVDTAGLRKKTKVHEDLEFYSVLRSVRAIEACDVGFLVLDATQGIEGQDLNIFRLLEKNNKGVVIIVNKWDLVAKDTLSTKHFEEKIRERLAPFVDVPIVFTSALTKQRVLKAMEEGIDVYKRKTQRIPTSQLNEDFLPLLKDNPPPSTKGKYIKIKYLSQIPKHYPIFAIYANLPQYIKDPYKRYVENQLRKKYDFTGVPISIFFRK
ncbi:MAG: ribosome biogenesis GTPase Der [Schleiferiaceae bacterium]|nr:ribosome biogenesis GTPase Der [Schleiferiaceae bacterium]